MSHTTDNNTKLLLVRHGETDANASGTWQGSTDSQLNARGRAQAQAVAERLAGEKHSLNAIYSSPLGRAVETANIIAAQTGQPPIHLDPGLAEFHLGEWEGLTYEELRTEKRLWERLREDPYFAPPGGESAVQFATRLLTSLSSIAGAHDGQTVLVVSHGGAIATALSVMLEQDGNRWNDYQMANCALSELVMLPVPKLMRLNEKSHLQAVGALAEWD